MPLSDPHRDERQVPVAEALVQLYRALRKSHSDETLLPKFARLAAMLFEDDAAEEVAL